MSKYDKFKDAEKNFLQTIDSQFYVIRLDGKAFHTYTRSFEKPFDSRIEAAFQETAQFLANQIQGVKLIYSQSDEITIICGARPQGEHWFSGKVQKIVSTSASLATAKFNQIMTQLRPEFKHFAIFDSRVFVVPKEELVESLEWRQADAIRNSVSASARACYSHSELQNKSVREMKAMLEECGQPWDDLTLYQKQGFVVIKKTEMKYVEYLGEEIERDVWKVEAAPIFKETPEIIDILTKDTEGKR